MRINFFSEVIDNGSLESFGQQTYAFLWSEESFPLGHRPSTALSNSEHAAFVRLSSCTVHSSESLVISKHLRIFFSNIGNI